MRDGGGFFLKEDHGMMNAERPWLYAVEDPNDATNDIGRSSWNARRVRRTIAARGVVAVRRRRSARWENERKTLETTVFTVHRWPLSEPRQC